MNTHTLQETRAQLSVITLQLGILAGMYASLSETDRRAFLGYVMTQSGHVDQAFKGIGAMLVCGFDPIASAQGERLVELESESTPAAGASNATFKRDVDNARYQLSQSKVCNNCAHERRQHDRGGECYCGCAYFHEPQPGNPD